MKAHPKVWTGPNIPGPGETEEEINILAETQPASIIANMRRELETRKAAGNPPNPLFELHCRNVKKIHGAGMVIGLGTVPGPGCRRLEPPSTLHSNLQIEPSGLVHDVRSELPVHSSRPRRGAGYEDCNVGHGNPDARGYRVRIFNSLRHSA